MCNANGTYEVNVMCPVDGNQLTLTMVGSIQVTKDADVRQIRMDVHRCDKTCTSSAIRWTY